jgi:hypothetical protein
VTPKHGDWICECGELCFGSKDVCWKCGKSKNTAEFRIERANDQDNNNNNNNDDNNNDNNDNDEKIENSNTTRTESECVVCMDQSATLASSKCGHLCMCQDCSNLVSNCPICRQPFAKENLIKIFIS